MLSDWYLLKLNWKAETKAGGYACAVNKWCDHVLDGGIAEQSASDGWSTCENGTTQFLTASPVVRSGKSRLATSKCGVYWLHRTYSGTVSTLQKSVPLSCSKRCVHLPPFLCFRIEPNNAVRWVLFCMRKVWASSLTVLRIVKTRSQNCEKRL